MSGAVEAQAAAKATIANVATVRRIRALMSSWPEDGKPFPLRGRGLRRVKRDELEGAGVAVTRDERGTDVQRIGSAQRMTLDDPLGVSAHEIDRRDLGPALPCIEKLTAHTDEAIRGARELATTT